MDNKKDIFTKEETKMIENDMKKVVRGLIFLLGLMILYVLTSWKVWLIVSALPIVLFIQVILGLFFLKKKKQKEKRENDELDF